MFTTLKFLKHMNSWMAFLLYPNMMYFTPASFASEPNSIRLIVLKWNPQSPSIQPPAGTMSKLILDSWYNDLAVAAVIGNPPATRPPILLPQAKMTPSRLPGRRVLVIQGHIVDLDRDVEDWIVVLKEDSES